MTTTQNLELLHMQPSQIGKTTVFNQAIAQLDKLLSQEEEITVTTNATLTDSECFFYSLSFIGTPGATRTITLTKNKQYLLKNNLSDSSSIQVKGTSGSAISIANGSAKKVYIQNNTIFDESGTFPSAPFLIDGNPNDYGLPNGINIQNIADIDGIVFTPSANTITPLHLKGFTGQSADLLSIENSSGTALASFSSGGNLNLHSTQKVINSANASASKDLIPKGQADSLYAPIVAPYLTNGGNATLTNEIDIQSLASTLAFIASAGTVTPLEIKGGSSQSVNLFQIKDNTNTVQLAVNSNYQLDAKNNSIINVKDPVNNGDAVNFSFLKAGYAPSSYQFGNASGGSDAASRCFSPAGALGTTTTPLTSTGEQKIRAGRAFKVIGMSLKSRTGPTLSSYDVTLRKNGVNQTMTFNVGVGVTEASTFSNPNTFTATDDLSIEYRKTAATGLGPSDVFVIVHCTNE